MFNKESLTKEKIKKITSVESLVICILLFIAATYAWFTDIAKISGNKIYVGSSKLAIISSLEDVKKQIDPNGSMTNDELNNELNKYSHYVYERNYSDTSKDTYYMLSNIPDSPIAVFSFYNMAPGSSRTFTITYLAVGELAFNACSYFDITVYDDKPASYTGLETLNQQYKASSKIFRNKYYDGIIDLTDPNVFSDGYVYDNSADSIMDYSEYERRFNKLAEKQTIQVESGGGVYKYENESALIPKEINTLSDNGGHLEDILEVYIHDANDSLHYLGTIKEFIFMMNNGANASLELSDDIIDLSIDTTVVDYIYKSLKNDKNANLYNDYNNYLKIASSFVIPASSIKDNNEFISKNGVEVKVKDYLDNPDVEKNYSGIKEFSSNTFTIVMPSSADDKYKNASIDLSARVYANQVSSFTHENGFHIEINKTTN